MFYAPDLNGLQDTRLLVAGVTWSLRYEWLFYLILPLPGFFTFFCRRPFEAHLSAAALAAIFYRSDWYNRFDVGILQSFFGGIAAAHWVRNPALVRIGRTTASGLTAIAALTAVATFVPTATHGKRPSD